MNKKVLNRVHDQLHSKGDISQVLKFVGTVLLKLVGTVILKLVGTQDHLEIVKMADRVWKSMPAALKRPTLDELYRRLRDLDYTQVDERMAVMLNAILQLEEQGECRESATETVLMVGYTTEGISNQEQTRWLSWYLCFLVTRVNERNTIDPEHVMLALARLRDFMVERVIMEVSMPVYDPNRGKLSPRELYAILHVVFAETEIMVNLHKKYCLSIA